MKQNNVQKEEMRSFSKVSNNTICENLDNLYLTKDRLFLPKPLAPMRRQRGES